MMAFLRGLDTGNINMAVRENGDMGRSPLGNKDSGKFFNFEKDTGVTTVNLRQTRSLLQSSTHHKIGDGHRRQAFACLLLEFVAHDEGDIVGNVAEDLYGPVSEDLHVSTDAGGEHEHLGPTGVEGAAEVLM